VGAAAFLVATPKNAPLIPNTRHDEVIDVIAVGVLTVHLAYNHCALSVGN
jgi:hypothetical protein